MIEWLTGGPITSIVITLLAYCVALGIYNMSGKSPLANPVLLGMAIVIAYLMITDTEYEGYFQGAKIIHFLLGTATVALAVPLYRYIDHLKRTLVPILLSVFSGALAASLSAVITAFWLGGSTLTQLSLASKSTTTPVAMAITEQIGGLPALTAVAVIVTGILGAITALTVLRIVGVRDQKTQGLALGVAAHGIGTARALQINPELGAYAGLAMGLSALFTALLVPALWYLLTPVIGG